MKYRSDIDGLRAIAILPVVLYHTGFSIFQGGFVGVDIFFVISGYLITGIIHDEIGQNRFTIAGFYIRRIRRIFPALFAVLFCSSVVAVRIMLPRSFETFGQSVVAATLFVANIFFWTESGYFGAAAETKPLLHTWSLSIEEQFYLLFPFVLLLIHRKFQGRWRFILLPAALVSLVFSIWGVWVEPSAAFYLIPSRAWELLIGSFLALGLLPQCAHRGVRECTSFLGLLLILWAVFFFSAQTPFPGWHALAPCIGAALIIHAGTGGSSLVARLLSLRVMVFVGLISYSLYLWHWPIMVFARELLAGNFSNAAALTVVAVSFLLAFLSWRYIERPFRKPGLHKPIKVFALAAILMTISVCFGSLVNYSEGWPGRFGDQLISLEGDLESYNLGTCFLKEDQPASQWQGERCVVQEGHSHNVLLWGDSFAAHYVPGVMANPQLIDANIIQYSAGGCAPVFDFNPAYRPYCKEFSAGADGVITDYDIHTVVMAAAWQLALDNGLSFEALKSTMARLRAKGIRVIVIGQSPRFSASVQDVSNRATIRGADISTSKVDIDLARLNAQLKYIAGSENFVDPSTVFCVQQECRFKEGEEFFFWDDGHYTTLGSTRAARYIFPKISL